VLVSCPASPVSEPQLYTVPGSLAQLKSIYDSVDYSVAGR
jgi:hypothetical protein